MGMLASKVPSVQGFPVTAGVSNTTLEVHNVNITLSDRFNSTVTLHNETFTSFSPRSVNMHGIATDTKLNVINATPYRWRRGYRHSYQLRQWSDATWPEFVEPGEVFSVNTVMGIAARVQDTAGEVAYHLEKTSKPMSFMVEYRGGNHPHIWVRFMQELHTETGPKGSQMDIGLRGDGAGVNFVLAGREGHFVSHDAPVGWMQSQLATIGDVPLNQVVVPRSHHAGMWKAVRGIGLVQPATTVCQRRTAYEQMAAGGVRVLDFRPYRHRDGRYSTAHMAVVEGLHHGMIGASLQEMIGMINQFNREHPGELVVLDIHEDQSWAGARDFYRLNHDDRVALYKELAKLEHRMAVPDSENIGLWPLKRFIGSGQSAVLIHAPRSWRDNDKASFPGGAEGLVTNNNLFRVPHWSDTDKPWTLRSDQAARLARHVGAASPHVHDMQWILALQGVSNVIPQRSITELAGRAYGALYDGVWGMVGEGSYPGWITTDAVETGEVKALAMAMNQCLAAQKCGKLGGKVMSASD